MNSKNNFYTRSNNMGKLTLTKELKMLWKPQFRLYFCEVSNLEIKILYRIPTHIILTNLIMYFHFIFLRKVSIFFNLLNYLKIHHNLIFVLNFYKLLYYCLFIHLPNFYSINFSHLLSNHHNNPHHLLLVQSFLKYHIHFQLRNILKILIYLNYELNEILHKPTKLLLSTM